MQYDFSQVEDVQDFVAVPNGTYLCRLAEVRERRSRDGSARWSLRWIVEEGPYAGRTAAWDNLTWSDRGIRRVKFVLGRLGQPVEGVVEVEPQSLVGRIARLSVFSEEFVNPATGVRQVRSRVPFAGYEAAEAAPSPEDAARGAGGQPQPADPPSVQDGEEEEAEAPF
ncbi:MAG TPA: DUF669 domain-containing protein [Planctomycetota bacterium]|jgi:hypothetical protein|nr:DUF669 domain-containing protein [Planctomycetota bacterium]